MGSIYKKGRDGYYYYQAYIYNSETGKKNKRVFHALKTKDLETAKKKQLSLDNKYKKLKFGDGFIFKKKNKYYLLKLLFFILLLIAGSNMIYNEINNPEKKPLHHKKSENVIPMPVSLNKNSLKDSSALSLLKGLNSKIENNVSTILNENALMLPDYKIHRVDEITEGFNQALIYGTIYGDYNKAGLLSLNRGIIKDYSNFSNFIICLYSGNNRGIMLAKGNSNQISIEDKKEYWISMYSFNEVEGEYFDDKPTSYHGEN
jgi:hypothetical protein